MNKIIIRPDRMLIFFYVFILLFFPYYSNVIYKALNYGAALLIFIYIFLNLNKYKNNISNHHKVVYGYILWLLSIVILMFAASFWSGYFSGSFSKTLIMLFSTLGQIALIVWCAGSRERLKYIIDISILIASIILLKIFITTPLAASGNQTLFKLYTGYDKNGFAMMGAFLSVCAMLMYYSEKKQIYIIGWLLMVTIAIIGGSRKGALIIFVSWPMFVFLKNKFVKKIIYIIVFSIVGIFLIKFIMTNRVFYDLVGERLHNLFSKFFGAGSGDGSITEREKFIELGWNLFCQKKLFGWGTDGFAIQMQRIIGRYVYSHCNYIEMLCNFGILGFVLYYVYYFTIIKTTVLQIFKKNSYIIFSFIIFVLFLVFEYGFVSYYEIINNFIKTLAVISLTCVYDHEKNSKNFERRNSC